MSVGKFLSGFIVGSAVGGVIGLLLAPASGEETRGMIVDKSDEIYKNTEDSVKEIQNKANDVIENIQQKGDELLAKIQENINKQG